MADDEDDEGTDARSRSSDPSTSHEAAERMQPSKLQRLVLDVLRRNYPNPMTSMEVARTLDVHPWSVSPRFVPLEEKGLVERAGKKVTLNSNGKPRNMQAWRAKRKPGEPERVAEPVVPTRSPPVVEKIKAKVHLFKDIRRG